MRSISFINESNQSEIKVNNPNCNCQKHVFDAINQFIAEHGFPVGGEGMVVDISKSCFDQDGNNLILRPETSAQDPIDNISFYVTNDYTGKTKNGYEMGISFHEEKEDDE